MTPSSCALMAEYNRWMNMRLYDAVAQLTEEEIFEDRGAYFGSLFDTLNHIVVGDTIWLHRFSGHPDLGWMKALMASFAHPSSLRQRVASSLSELRDRRERLDGVIGEFGSRITEAQLESRLSYSNTSGQAQTRSFRGLVQHFFNHQTHHRGQATTLLSQAGVDVGVTDLLAILPRES